MQRQHGLTLWVVIGVLLLNGVSGNLYQTCCNGVSSYYSSYTPQAFSDASPLNLQTTSHRSIELPDGSSINFNICGPTEACKGALACRATPNGELDRIFAVASGSVFYDYTYSSSTQFEMTWSSNFLQPYCENESFTINLKCASGVSFNVTQVNYNDDNDCDVVVYADSIYGCPKSSGIPTYISPTSYTDFTAPIYLQGTIPMFSLDRIAVENNDQEFVGTIYFSEQYNSLLLNGTITGPSGGSSEVSYLYQGTVPDLNPPRLYARVTPPGFSSPVCVLLSPDEYESEEIDLFSTSVNPEMSLQRQYTSVYFNKGSFFTVNTWAYSQSSQPFITLQQTTDGKVVSIGSYQLASPLVDQYPWPPFISEINWKSISSAALPEELFSPPSSWNCPNAY